MGELESAVDALAGDDLDGMVAPQFLDRMRMLVRARNQIDAELARTAHRAELAQAPEHDGLKSMPSWLRGHCRLSPADATRVVRNGRALEHLPAVAAACADGQVTADQVSVIAPVTRPEYVAAAATQGVDLDGIDGALAEVAASRPHADLGKVVHYYLSHLDPDGPEPDPTEQRFVSIAKHSDGTVTFRGELDAVGGEKFQAALESILQANRPAGDTRSRGQQLGDALVQFADNALAAGNLPFLRTVKPHVVVTIPLADLADPHHGPGAAETGFGARISAARARWLACDGNITRIVIGPEGQPLDLGRTKRVYPPHLRRATEARDRHCVFTGCYAPSYWCDVHHLLHWIDGGETDLDNSALLCESHSHLVCTTASASPGFLTADGAPGDPTAPRSSCGLACSLAELRLRERSWPYSRQTATSCSGATV